MIDLKISSFVLPMKGGDPVSKICVITPIAQISTGFEYGTSFTSSGAIYKGLPSTYLALLSGCNKQENPKSANFKNGRVSLLLEINMFSGFKSLCRIFYKCI